MVCHLLCILVVYRKQDRKEFSLKIALEQLQREGSCPVADDLQYFILKMFAEWDGGEEPPLDISKRVITMPVLYYLTLLLTGVADRYIFHQSKGRSF